MLSLLERADFSLLLTLTGACAGASNVAARPCSVAWSTVAMLLGGNLKPGL